MSVSSTSSSAHDVVQVALARLRSGRQRQIAERAQEAARNELTASQVGRAGQIASPAAGQQRYEQITRIMTVIELVAPLRYGATVSEVLPDVCHEFGPVGPRTVLRDLQFLESLGLLDRIGERYVWRDGNFRSIVHREVAKSWRKAAAAREAVSAVAAIRQHAEDEGWTDSDSELEIGWPDPTEEELTA